MKTKEKLQKKLDIKLSYHDNLLHDLKTVQKLIDKGDLKKANKWLEDLQ